MKHRKIEKYSVPLMMMKIITKTHLQYTHCSTDSAILWELYICLMYHTSKILLELHSSYCQAITTYHIVQ